MGERENSAAAQSRNFSSLRDFSADRYCKGVVWWGVEGVEGADGGRCLSFPVCTIQRAEWGCCMSAWDLAKQNRPLCLKGVEKSSS